MGLFRHRIITTMLSRVAINQARTALAVQPIRFTSTSASKSAAASDVAAQEGPEVRMGFIPEEWFQFFHAKTGVTGPYAFGVGLATFLCSKEIYIMEHEFYGGLSIGIMAVYAIKKFGPGLGAYLDKEVEKDDAALDASRNMAIENSQEAITSEKVEQERAQAQVMVFDAKHENVALQLEAAYRANLVKVHSEVKKRLDYQLEIQNVQRNMEQKQMVDWVIRSVEAAVTPAQEKAALTQCIANIKALAKENTARI